MNLEDTLFAQYFFFEKGGTRTNPKKVIKLKKENDTMWTDNFNKSLVGLSFTGKGFVKARSLEKYLEELTNFSENNNVKEPNKTLAKYFLFLLSKSKKDSFISFEKFVKGGDQGIQEQGENKGVQVEEGGEDKQVEEGGEDKQGEEGGEKQGEKLNANFSESYKEYLKRIESVDLKKVMTNDQFESLQNARQKLFPKEEPKFGFHEKNKSYKYGFTNEKYGQGGWLKECQD